MLTDEATRYFIVVESVVVIITLVFGFYSYVTKQAGQAAAEDLGRSCCETRQMGYFVARKPNTLAYFFRRKTTQIPAVPTIENIIRAGDRLLFTSSMFDHVYPSPQDVCWVGLYKQFFNEMAWLPEERTSKARTADEAISAYMKQADARVDQLQKGNSKSARRASGTNKESSRDCEKGKTMYLNNLMPMRPETNTPVRHCLFPGKWEGLLLPTLVSCILPLEPFRTISDGAEPQPNTLDLPDIRPLWLVDKQPCIEMSREELAGFALSIGTPLVKHRDGSMSGTGPFGAHLSLSRINNYWKLQLTHQHRQLDHEMQYGSGYTTLLAKHLACNSLPVDLGEGKGILRSIHVGPDFLKWISDDEFAQSVNKLREVNKLKEARDELRKKEERLRIELRNVETNADTVSELREVVEEQKRQQNLYNALLPLQAVPQTAPELKYLYRLPSAYEPEEYCYMPPPKHSDESDNKDGSARENGGAKEDRDVKNDEATKDDGKIKDDGTRKEDRAVEESEIGEFPLHWFKAVARIAFGGLVPQAGESIINAVLFTVTGGSREEFKGRLSPDNLREQDAHDDDGNSRADNFLKPRGRNHSVGTQSRETSARRSRISYYGRKPSDDEFQSCSMLTMALQRLVDALHTDCREFKLFGDYVEKRVRHQLTTNETDCSIPATPRHAGALFNRYMTALERLVAKSLYPKWGREVQDFSWLGTILSRFDDPKSGNETEAGLQVKKVYEQCAELLFLNYRKDNAEADLKANVDKVTRKIQQNENITVDDCANVARCIIASWALRVPPIQLEWEEWSCETSTAAFNQLPSVLAFG